MRKEIVKFINEKVSSLSILIYQAHCPFFGLYQSANGQFIRDLRMNNAYIQVTFTEDSIGYGSRVTPRLLAALIAHLQKHFYPITPIEPGNILVTSNGTALGSMLGITLAEPGDGILVSRPMYGRFELDYGLAAGAEIVYADTDPEEAFSPAVVEKYELALKEAEKRGQKIRAVLLVNPNNPVGQFPSFNPRLSLVPEHQPS
jgi:aspartate/methionine/tyrosine aminotransferase